MKKIVESLNTQNGLSKLEYYKFYLRFKTSMITNLLPNKLSDFLSSIHTFKNRRSFQYGLLMFYFIIFSTVSFLIYYFLPDKNLSLVLLVELNFIVSIVLFIMGQSRVDYFIKNLPNDHFYQLLGTKKFSFLISTIKVNNRNTILTLLSCSFMFLLLLIYQNHQFIFIISYLLFIFSYYMFGMILTYLRLIMSSSYSYTLNSVIKYIGTIVLILLCFIIIMIAINMDHFLIQILIYGLIFLGLLVFYHFILIQLQKNPHKIFVSKVYHIKRNNKQVGLKIPFVTTHLSHQEKLVFNKDFKLLYRSNQMGFITFLISYIISFFFVGGFIFNNLTIHANLVDQFNLNIIILNIFLMVITALFYVFKKYTWFSSEKENYFIYNMTPISYFSLFKTKKRVNYTLFMPYFLLFSLGSLICIVINTQMTLNVVFSIVYFYLMLKFIIDKVLYYDFIGPKANLGGQFRWVGDIYTLGTIFMILIFMVPFGFRMFTDQVVTNDTQLSYVLIGTIGLLIILNGYSIIQSHRIKKIKRISYGGVIYDKMS